MREKEQGYVKMNTRDDTVFQTGLTNVERKFAVEITTKDARYVEIQGNYSCLTT